jgi:hypothetical protein
MSKKINTVFKIGDYVWCEETVSMVREDNKKILVKNPAKFSGWVVGVTRRFEGEVVPEKRTRHYLTKDEVKPAYFRAKKSYLVYKVARGMMNTPVEVLEEDLAFDLDEKSSFTAPLKVTYNPCQCDERYREYMRSLMSKWPRDSKGRWMKNGLWSQ